MLLVFHFFGDRDCVDCWNGGKYLSRGSKHNGNHDLDTATPSTVTTTCDFLVDTHRNESHAICPRRHAITRHPCTRQTHFQSWRPNTEATLPHVYLMPPKGQVEATFGTGESSVRCGAARSACSRTYPSLSLAAYATPTRAKTMTFAGRPFLNSCSPAPHTR